MKSNINPKNWKQFVNNLIEDIIKLKSSNNVDLIINILVLEERWNELTEYLNSIHYYMRFEYLDKLIQNYKTEEVAEVYAKIIFLYLNYFKGDDYNNNATKGLKKLIENGFVEKSTLLIKNLKIVFPRKYSLLDKLKVVESLIQRI